MNREELSNKIWGRDTIEMNEAEKLADFILANFTPKGEAEKVTAKECYLVIIGSVEYEGASFEEIAELAHESAKAFNEYKPE